MSTTYPKFSANRFWTKYLDPETRVHDKPPVLVTGAGCSMPALPGARELKVQIAQSLIRQSGKRIKPASLLEVLEQPYFTLEVLGTVLSYFAGNAYDPVGFWKTMVKASKPNATSTYIAELKKEGLIGPILTINFDDFIYRAMDGKIEVITAANVPKNLLIPENSLVALHGTVIKGKGLSDPSSVVNRGFTKPLNPSLYESVRRLLLDDARAVIFAGISGGDHYDFNLLLRKITDSSVGSRSLWFSRRRSGEGLNRFVHENYPKAIVNCDACEVFGKSLARHTGSKNVEYSESDDALWRMAVSDYLGHIDQRGARAAVQAILNNTIAGWVTLEHYLLYSTGYSVELASDMLGEAKYHGIDLTGYTSAHEQYWKDKNRYAGAKELGVVAPQFRASRTLFEQVASDCRTALEKPKLAGIDRAMIMTLEASCSDYIGLMDLHYLGELESQVQKCRRSTLRHFANCKKLADEASKKLIGFDNHQKDFIPFDIWGMIAEENTARALPMPDRANRLKEVAKAREDRIEAEKASGNNEYLLGHYPQCWLRWAECAKAWLGCSNVDDTPGDHVSEAYIRKAKKAITSARRNLKKYQVLSSQVNHREAVIVDAEICLALSRPGELASRLADARDLAMNFEVRLKEAGAKGRVLDFLKNSRKRIERFEESRK